MDEDASQRNDEPARTTVGKCTIAAVQRAAARDGSSFRCQATELKAYSKLLPWWDMRQYVKDVATNEVGIGALAGAFFFAAYRKLTELGVGYGVLVGLYDRVQRVRGRQPFPLRAGTCTKTPTEHLDLQPGERVRVKSYDQILATLDSSNKNRGLWFDSEMVQFCGQTFRVARRVKRILDEKTGKMLVFSNPCIVLDDVFCRATKTKHRLFCPRSNLIYWREIWLERVSDTDPGRPLPALS